ncbi:MAG: CDP-alcohol phosphatidyltransferase family protein [Actinobacteria bacterium]|nr:CDP-alcohol phosphatidyltransferase family protein [Actinomycetota bacterium]
MTDGERWTADQLEVLRAARFMPLAWLRFLRSSFRRAALTRRERPELASQARVWAAAGYAAGLGASVGGRRAGIAAPRAAAWTAWWLATAAMLDWHLGMVEGSAGERRDRLSPADAVTLLRLGLVPFLAVDRSRGRDAAAYTVLLVAAGATDLVDGALARSHGPTRLGRDLDTVADVLVGGAGVRAARRAGWIRAGPAALAAARYALPLAVVTASYLRSGHRPAHADFGATRLTAPALLGGLALSPQAPLLGDGLIVFGSLAALLLGWPGRRARGAA